MNNIQNRALVAVLCMAPALAMAQVGTLSTMGNALNRALCLVAGASSPIVAFIAVIAVVVFFVVLALNEGNSMVTWAIKIMIGVAGLIAATSIVTSLFGITAATCA